MGETILEIRHLSKAFGDHQVLRDIDFTVEKGDVTSIIGASGSGKSTLLRCINLLETPTGGEILYHGKNVAGRGVNAADYRSHVGMVFQSFNLFNNMTVLENCMVGQIKVLKKNKEDARKSAMNYLEKVGMAPYINAKPRQTCSAIPSSRRPGIFSPASATPEHIPRQQTNARRSPNGFCARVVFGSSAPPPCRLPFAAGCAILRKNTKTGGPPCISPREPPTPLF